MRRSFTLLELVLAMGMASLVSVGAFGVLNMVSRSDRIFESRAGNVQDLSTLHGLLQEAFGSLVMSNAQRPAGTVGGESVEGDLDSLMEFDETDEDHPDRPRMILRADSSALATIPDQGNTPQVFEIVVRDGLASFNEPSNLGSDALAALQQGREAIRGVLELRPEGREWSLWWRPVRDDGTAIGLDYEADRRSNALRLCRGLTTCQWKIFYRDRRLTTYQATWSNDLPAYLELELETGSGVYANWVFEIGWQTASETSEVDTQGVGDDGERAGGGGASGASGARATDAAPSRRSDRSASRTDRSRTRDADDGSGGSGGRGGRGG